MTTKKINIQLSLPDDAHILNYVVHGGELVSLVDEFDRFLHEHWDEGPFEEDPKKLMDLIYEHWRPLSIAFKRYEE